MNDDVLHVDSNVLVHSAAFKTVDFKAFLAFRTGLGLRTGLWLSVFSGCFGWFSGFAVAVAVYLFTKNLYKIIVVVNAIKAVDKFCIRLRISCLQLLQAGA